MIRWFKAYLIRRRFERHFVKPFARRIQITRERHARGVSVVRQEQRELVLRALRGGR